MFRCVYEGGIEAFGNGKMDKQAKLVAAWNMIERLKKNNIGIVNETLATGIVVDKSVLKKPVTTYKIQILGPFLISSADHRLLGSSQVSRRPAL